MSNRSFSFSDEEKEEKIIHPDAIIDARESLEKEKSGYTSSSRQSERPFRSIKEEQHRGFFSLRLTCLFGFLFCALLVGGLLIGSLGVGFLAVICFLQNRTLNQSLFLLWGMCKKLIIAGGGFALGILSPVLGLGFLAVYFSLAADREENHFFRRIIERAFRPFG